jgi:hypothetical protein
MRYCTQANLVLKRCSTATRQLCMHSVRQATQHNRLSKLSFGTSNLVQVCASFVCISQVFALPSLALTATSDGTYISASAALIPGPPHWQHSCIHHRDADGNSLDTPIIALAKQGRGSDGTAPAPYLRLTLILLAAAQYFRLAAALPAGSVPNQPKGSRAANAALRAAVQQQLTPSCASQLLQRLAPNLWEVVGRRKLSPGRRVLGAQDGGVVCTISIEAGLWSVEQVCRDDTSDPMTLATAHLGDAETVHALGEPSNVLATTAILQSVLCGGFLPTTAAVAPACMHRARAR